VKADESNGLDLADVFSGDNGDRPFKFLAQTLFRKRFAIDIAQPRTKSFTKKRVVTNNKMDFPCSYISLPLPIVILSSFEVSEPG